MLNQFSRFQLIIGEEAISKLKDKKIAIFGLGGVGGHVCDALARSGIENFVLVDNDKVAITNINRQIIANMKTIGLNKVDVMEEHLKDINPSIKVEKHKCFYLPEKADEFDFNKYDYVIDAIDTVTAKIDIISRCKALNVPIISALGCGNKINPLLLEISDLSKTSYDPLAKVLRRELKKRGINHLKVVYSKESPVKTNGEINEEPHQGKTSIPGSSPFVPSVAGILIASEVVKDLIDYEKED